MVVLEMSGIFWKDAASTLNLHHMLHLQEYKIAVT